MGKSPKRENYFTKHLFGAGLECPTKLFYYAQDYPENKQAIPFIEHAVFNKRLLKALARSVYPKGIFVDAGSIPEAASQTRQLLNQNDEVVLFNAIFEHRQMMARLPIVHKKDDQLTVFHIQTKAFDPQKHRLADEEGHIYDKWRSYLFDFAYQLYVIKQNEPDAQLQPFLVMPNKRGRAHTDNLPSLLQPLDDRREPVSVPAPNQKLLVKIEVFEILSVIWKNPSFAETYLPKGTFEDSVNYLRDMYLNRKKETPDIGLKCKNCEFRIEKERVEKGVTSGFNECWNSQTRSENPSEQHIFDLIGSGTTQRIQQEIYHQRDISTDNIFSVPTILNGTGRISHDMRQALQIHKVKGNNIPEQIIRSALFRELEKWEYPLHFLDFEAGNYAVPLCKGRSPYHLVLFQFSCHTLHEDGRWVHHQWIDDRQNNYPNYELIRNLMEVPQILRGTIVQYSDFERHALKTIRRELRNEEVAISDKDKLINWIGKVIHGNDSTHYKPPFVGDLSRMVKHFYYNSEMGNSLSIKDVLQSVMSHSDYLKKKYSKPYSSHNFEDIIWWQPDKKGGARNPYSILTETGDSPIRRGTEAMVVYGKLITKRLSKEQRRAYRNALLKYCELDTLAMVMIYQHLRQEILAEQ